MNSIQKTSDPGQIIAPVVPGSVVHGVECISKTKRLFIYDRFSQLHMLIDTGAEVSVIPKEAVPAAELSNFKLFNADSTLINTYGSHNIELQFDEEQTFKCRFVAKLVPYAIIGADFIYGNKLIIDLFNKRVLHSDGRVFAVGSSIRNNDNYPLNSVPAA
uniref:Peptidase A2 domain-containing protein n=1 Tax=Trichogramma kaykai TaxID=54128 RepID=A0ABD2WF09_9HYME